MEFIFFTAEMVLSYLLLVLMILYFGSYAAEKIREVFKHE